MDFDALARINPDVKAWIYIKGTGINYPIVQTTDNTSYLHSFHAATQKTTIHNRRSRFEKNPLPFLFFFLLISTPISDEEAVR